MSRSELYNRFRHTRNIQHMVIVCQCCEPLFVFNGLWRWSLWFRALSCHVQNFTIVSDIHEIYSTWSSFVSVVNHCLFSTVCGGGVCGFALFRHGGGWIHGEWRLGKFVTTLWYDCIMVSWCGCSLSKTLVGSCIAFFGLNCCLAGRSVACKAW